MEPTPEMREALDAAKALAAEAYRVTSTFQDKDPKLAAQIRAAADRAVLNLELALEAWKKDSGDDLRM